MPFTAAHPAIILPFSRVKKIPLSVLIIGSLTPDFEYFIKMKLTGRYSHTIEGMFIMDLPIAFVLWLIFHQLVKGPLIDNIPPYFKGRLLPLNKFEYISHLKVNWHYIIIGFLVGILSHIIWDSFTHANEVIVVRWDWLSQPLFSNFPNLPVFRILQHLSTGIGALVIAFYFHRMPFQPCKCTIRLSFWLVLLGIAIVSFSIRAWVTFEYFGDVVATAISACCIGLILSSIIYRLRYE